MNVPDIEVFYPKLKRKKFIRGKLKDVVEELFPCYIFSRFNPSKHFHMIKYTRGVRRIIGDESGNSYIVDDAIIDQIQSRIEDGFIHLEPTQFINIGDKVVIQEGPLMGMMGVFQKEFKARDRVLILLNTIAYQASIEIEKVFLTKSVHRDHKC